MKQAGLKLQEHVSCFFHSTYALQLSFLLCIYVAYNWLPSINFKMFKVLSGLWLRNGREVVKSSKCSKDVEKSENLDLF